MITYDKILEFCVSAISDKPDKSESSMMDVIEQFRSFPNWDGEALLVDLKRIYNIVIGKGGVLTDTGHQPWLESKKADIDSYYWHRYRELLKKKGFAPLPLAEMDKTADLILGLMNDPTRTGPWDRRGMVLGHVQSGKTANYIGLINKAADAGYKVVIVIAGIHNNLRNQTQRRIDEGFRGIASADIKKSAGHNFVGVGSIDPSRQPSSFTTTIKDFNKAAAQQVGVPMSNLVEPAVFVIKKNARTLRALIDWLRQYSGEGEQNRIDEPLLLIDDEADNASINTNKDPDKATRINALIRELLEIFTRSAYVGYTATPFANIFVDPKTDTEMLGRDLFPKDFIVSLDAPSNYHGPLRIFDGAEDSTVLREVEDIDDYLPAVHKSDYVPENLPPSLKTAIRAFVLSRAIRIWRGQGINHSSMLVNVSQYVQTQKAVERLIHDYLEQIRNQLRLYGSLKEEQAEKYHHISMLRQTFDEEFLHLPETWDALFPLLWDAISPVQVLTINSKSSDALSYEVHSESGLHVIAVGGYSLSRGLTLEGLSTSYLSRNSKQYDTLMQMGRWFGYRPDYEDLCRIWLPPAVVSWYEHITEATEELRSDLVQMQQSGATPADFGLRVRSHPGALLVTARNKMGTGELVSVKMSLTKTFIETARLSSSPSSLQQNRDAARDLTNELVSNAQVIRSNRSGHTIFGRVPAQLITKFLSRWSNLPASFRTSPEQLIEFISERPDILGTWDVAFPGVTTDAREVGAHRSAFPIKMQKRTLGDEDTTTELRIGSKLRIMSPADETIGLSGSELASARRQATDRGIDTSKNIPGPDVRTFRSRPLLLVHYLDVIKKDGSRVTEDPIIGWSISFPGSTDPGEPVEYLVNRTFLEEMIIDSSAGDDFEEDE